MTASSLRRYDACSTRQEATPCPARRVEPDARHGAWGSSTEFSAVQAHRNIRRSSPRVQKPYSWTTDRYLARDGDEPGRDNASSATPTTSQHLQRTGRRRSSTARREHADRSHSWETRPSRPASASSGRPGRSDGITVHRRSGLGGSTCGARVRAGYARWRHRPSGGQNIDVTASVLDASAPARQAFTQHGPRHLRVKRAHRRVIWRAGKTGSGRHLERADMLYAYLRTTLVRTEQQPDQPRLRRRYRRQPVAHRLLRRRSRYHHRHQAGDGRGPDHRAAPAQVPVPARRRRPVGVRRRADRFRRPRAPVRRHDHEPSTVKGQGQRLRPVDRTTICNPRSTRVPWWRMGLRRSVTTIAGSPTSHRFPAYLRCCLRAKRRPAFDQAVTTAAVKSPWD